MSNESNKGPVDMEGMGEEGVPTNIKGREVNPDKDPVAKPNTEIKPADEHMANILEHVPEGLKERVSNLTRAELSLPGLPRDREAYEAYLGAEKMIRDLARRETKRKMNWKGLPKQNG